MVLECAGKDGGIEGVGEAVLKHDGQGGVGDAALNALDGLLDRGAGEVALGLGRTGFGQDTLSVKRTQVALG